MKTRGPCLRYSSLLVLLKGVLISGDNSPAGRSQLAATSFGAQGDRLDKARPCLLS